MPETVIGTRTKLELMSKTHGAIRVPLAQSFDYTPKYTERTIFEFDRSDAILIVSVFDGVDVKFDYFDTDSHLVDSVFNDLSPAATVTKNDPSTLKHFNGMLNIRSESTGKIFQSVYMKEARVKGFAATEPVREESKITVDASALNVIRLKGAAIMYVRMLDFDPDPAVFLQGASNSEVDLNFPDVPGPYVITLPHTAVAIDPAGSLSLRVLKNGNEVTTGFTLTTTTFTVPTEPADTDIWELWAAYIDS